MDDNRALSEMLTAIVMYFVTGSAWFMQESYQFFSWCAVFFATVLGAHALYVIVRDYFRKE